MRAVARRVLNAGLVALGTLISLSCLAQNTNSGDIRGTVTDSTGAVIPGASVKIEDIDKGVVHTLKTDGAGLYDSGPIVPDHYILTFATAGFQTFIRGPVVLQVGINTVDAQLRPGSVDQQVVVTEDLPLLSTESGTQSTTLDAKELLNLPQAGADWENFVVLLPGVSNNMAHGQSASSNGNLPYNAVLADGATTSLPMSQNSDVSILETISELKVDDSAFSAQYGIGGMIFNQISKGGSNAWHGVGYEYFQNNALNAAPYAFGQTYSVPLLRYNNFGGTISGPILKNKLFFFFDYDRTINHGASSHGFITVPTDAMRAGDFTGQPTIYDPTTQTVDANGIVHRQSFATEYGNGNKIPSSFVDSVASAIQKYFPEPNTAGTTTNGQTINNYFYQGVPNSSPFIKYFGRLDYDVTKNQRLTISETESDSPGAFLNEGLCPINCQHADVSRDNAQVSDVWTISPSFINEARLGFTDQFNFFSPYSLGEGFPQKLGWQFAKADVFPNIGIWGACCYYLQSAGNAVYKEFVIDPSDVITLIRGHHVLHFGGEFLINRADSTAWGNINAGYMQFSGTYTTSTQGDTSNSGLPYADFLLGYSNGWSASVRPEWGGRIKNPQLFVQDDFKVRPTLTVNLGFRFQGTTGWSEVKGNESVFDPTVPNPGTGTLGAIWYGSTHANGRHNLLAPVWSTFLPRLGFSWQFLPDTVLRGGFGLYASTFSIDAYGNGMGQAFGSSGNLYDNTNGVDRVLQLSGTGNTAYQPSGLSVNSAYLNSPTTPDALNGQGVLANSYHTPVPTIYQWNLSLQRQLGANSLFELAYVASHGTNLAFPVNLNQVPESKLSPTDAGAVPYPQYLSITGGRYDAISNYHSLQASFQKRLVKGFQFNANYTWSHFLDDQDSSAWANNQGGNQNYQNAYVPGANYGASNFDVRNNFKSAGVYQLPFGKGRQYLSHNSLLDLAFGGWQTAGTFVWSSGLPFTPVMSTNSSYAQDSSMAWYPNVVGNPNLSHRGISEWFNVNAYAEPTAGTFGNARRNSLYGPRSSDFNLSLGKSFPLYEKLALLIRADATNVFNHTSFGQPDNVIGPGHSAQITGTAVSGRVIQLYGRLSF